MLPFITVPAAFNVFQKCLMYVWICMKEYSHLNKWDDCNALAIPINKKAIRRSHSIQ